MIINSDTLIDIEQSFKIEAGPGAGKTHWLVNHIKNVLMHSERLFKTRKIACITYTNIGVESILKKIDSAINRVEVSTIHSFLYRHVLKPYCSYLPKEYELDIEKLIGHIDTVIIFEKVKKWLNSDAIYNELKHPYSYGQLTRHPETKKALLNWLQSLYYEIDDNKEIIIKGDRTKAIFIKNNKEKSAMALSTKCLELLESDLLNYKKLYWKEGIIDHNDVLFLSYQLIIKHPFILEVLRAKFPYFLLDEFQDTNPIQTEIVSRIGEKETKIGVIGDRAQSIFEFHGAKPEQFNLFLLSDMKGYQITENRRSTKKIIDVLNYTRQDLKQEYYRNTEGEPPVILVGDKKKAYKEAKKLCNNQEIYSSSRRNELANIMKGEFDDTIIQNNIWDRFLEIESNDRGKIIRSFVNAVEFAQNGLYKEAIRKIEEVVRKIDKATDRKKRALYILHILLNKYDTYKDSDLMTFYSTVKIEVGIKLANFRDGKPKTFYQNTKYKELALYVKDEGTKSVHRTVHKTKGDEFDNVILLLEQEKDLDFLLKPNLSSNEEHRIYYVALSRARNKLFINVPELANSKRKQLSNLIEFIDV